MERLIPIIKTIILCGRLGIALRGHRDDGQLNDEVDISGQSGNFHALLAFRVESDDKLLKEHLVKTNKNAMYISKTIQNTFIDLCGQEILKTIVSEIKKIGYFAILADETTDSSHQEQLCFCIRYVSEDAFIKEEFISYGAMEFVDAKSITEEILSRVASIGLNIDNCIAQCYDGCSTMLGHIPGVTTRILIHALLAIYLHCASHRLNLVLNDSSKLTEIRHMFDIASAMINYINDSSGRRNIFDAQFISYCSTRFVERHDAIIRFCSNISSIV
ncbi:52 kDa repressor of the inhibitor of the protein kinase-like [Oopsacas minuta]|uniref:52 kDa repressor of the inhibitor of the protein kinase-like n=1 Tax=Oopsacas minuta TaxID=111878 RepID=A0AAV7JG05_9METZ|nr:52 kDa repressor of the inhibitor of the protein kinase-like [Oopsacas minuta]